MLCLERRIDQGIQFEVDGVAVEVKVLRIRGDYVKLGIIAKKEAVIDRTDEMGNVVPKGQKETA